MSDDDLDARRTSGGHARSGDRVRRLPGEPAYRAFDDHAAVPVSVVFCTHNDAPTIAQVVRRVPTWVKEIILTDCGSTDQTVALARDASPRVVARTEQSNDRRRAWSAGLALATGEIVVMLRGDGSHDPAELPRFLAALRTGADFAIGTRYLAGGGSAELNRFRWFGNRLLTRLANARLHASFSDIGYGYLAFWKRHLGDLVTDHTYGDFEAVLPLRARRIGIRMVEVPSYESLRHHSPSNTAALRDGVRMLRMILAAGRGD